jgi:uncharacterized membrane protein
MIYLGFAFLTALFESLKDLTGKLGLGHFNEYFISWALTVVALPILLPFLLFIEIPELNGTFYKALLAGGSLNAVSLLLYMRAIRISDLSVTIPMITFTPLFLLLTSPFMVGEYPSTLGVFGVLLIVFGSYMLNINQRGEGFWAPFKALVKDPGPRLMLLVAFIWSFTANIDKIGVQNSSPVFWSIAITCFLAAALFLPMLIYSKQTPRQVLKQSKYLIPLGIFNALTLLTQMAAINFVLVAYVISIKRGSAILSVCWGYLFLNEKGIRERLVGVIIMVAGVFLITLS